MHKYLVPIVALGLALPVCAQAATSKRLSYSIDSAAFTDVQLEMSVGEMEIEVYEGELIELDIEVEAQRRWFGLRQGDADDIELEQRDRGQTLYLGIDEDNLEQTWHVRLPAHLAVELNVGVGDVLIENFSNSLEAEMGVGAIEVQVTHSDYDEITATAGVGDAVLRGFGRGADNERSNLVGADAYFRGEGEHSIRIEIGVGDAQVRAR